MPWMYQHVSVQEIPGIVWRVFLRAVYERLGNSKFSRPALENLDVKLARYLNYRNGFFIEVGANDGYTQSNTYYLEKMLGWRGVLVEPIPELYRRCKRKRKRSDVFCCALVADDYPRSDTEIHYAGMMSAVDGAIKNEQEMVEHIQHGLKIQNLPATYTLQVPARTLESILDDLPQPVDIDFLSLDVEGYELNVLRGLNLKKHRPIYILVEARYFDEVAQFLDSKYDLVEQLTYHDYLFRLKNRTDKHEFGKAQTGIKA